MKIGQMINKIMSLFSMYKGMWLGLLGVWASAFVLSFFGLFAYSPLALTASMLVAVLSVYGASYACSRIFGVHAHFESSLITGLILTLIIAPSLEVPGLVVLAFAGIIAGVSKFILIHNGRHIFNPAALGAFILVLTGLGGADWWVATPVLTPVVVLVILLSLYKTHRMLVTGLFLVIAIPILLIVFATYGTNFVQSLYLLLSWPLLFAGGVMLVEPLTMPPRKWQMYIEAAVVAVLFALPPINLGFFQTSFAFAILVGNVIATIFANREKISLVLKQINPLTPTTNEFIFTPNKPLHYMAGQYMELQLVHKKIDFRGYRRAFSLTSAPGKEDISFGIKFYEPSSSFKKALKSLPLGSTITATGYWGDFVLPKNPMVPLLYVAGGIGITPFMSHIQAMHNYEDVRNVVLVYAVSDPAEIAYKDVLVRSGIKVIIVTTKSVKDLPKTWKQIKTSRLTQEAMAKAIPDIAQRHAYVSGPTPFVISTKRILRSLHAKRVKSDYFVGY